MILLTPSHLHPDLDIIYQMAWTGSLSVQVAVMTALVIPSKIHVIKFQVDCNAALMFLNIGMSKKH